MPRLEYSYGHADAQTWKRELDDADVVDAAAQGVEPDDKKATRAINEVIAEHSGDVCIDFPAGNYPLTGPIVGGGSRTVALRAKDDSDGRVQFRPVPGFRREIWRLTSDYAIVDGIDVNVEAEGVNARCFFRCKHGFVYHDSTHEGRQFNPGLTKDQLIRPHIYPVVEDPDGVGLIRDVHIPTADHLGDYGEGDAGRWGLWAGPERRGTLEVIETTIRECSSHGSYLSAGQGPANYRRSEIANNSGWNIRVPTNSVIEDTRSYFDISEYDGPAGNEEIKNGSCVLFESKSRASADAYHGACTLRDSELGIHDWPGSFANRAALYVAGSHGAVDVLGSRITVENDDHAPHVMATTPNGDLFGRHRKARDIPPYPHWVRFYNSVLDGDAGEGAAINTTNRPVVALDTVFDLAGKREPIRATEAVAIGCDLRGGLDFRASVAVDEISALAAEFVSWIDREFDSNDDENATTPTRPPDPPSPVLVIDGSESEGVVEYTYTLSSGVAAYGPSANPDDGTDKLLPNGRGATGRVHKGRDDYVLDVDVLDASAFESFVLADGGGDVGAVRVEIGGEDITDSLPIGVESESEGHAMLAAALEAYGLTPETTIADVLARVGKKN